MTGRRSGAKVLKHAHARRSAARPRLGASCASRSASFSSAPASVGGRLGGQGVSSHGLASTPPDSGRKYTSTPRAHTVGPCSSTGSVGSSWARWRRSGCSGSSAPHAAPSDAAQAPGASTTASALADSPPASSTPCTRPPLTETRVTSWPRTIRTPAACARSARCEVMRWMSRTPASGSRSPASANPPFTTGTWASTSRRPRMTCGAPAVRASAASSPSMASSGATYMKPSSRSQRVRPSMSSSNSRERRERTPQAPPEIPT